MHLHENHHATEKVLHYAPAQLTKSRDGWYIYYYVTNPNNNKWTRVRIRFNRIKNKQDRLTFAREFIIKLNEKLRDGYNPFVREDSPKPFVTLADAIENYRKYKFSELEKKSIRSYKSFTDYLLKWCNNGHTKLLTSEFRKSHAINLLLSLRDNPTISPRTYNNYLVFYRTLFNWLVQYEYCEKNYFLDMPKLPKRLCQKQRGILSREEVNSLLDFLAAYPHYRAMAALCYYCLLRPHDICHLKKSNFDFTRHTILIQKEWTKNDRDSLRVIPAACDKYLATIDWDKIPDNFYVFGKNKTFLPTKEKNDDREIGRFWQNVVRIRFGWGHDKQFYSLKDTGITNLISDGLPATAVQQQADHSSLEITQIYTHLQTPENFDALRNMPK